MHGRCVPIMPSAVGRHVRGCWCHACLGAHLAMTAYWVVKLSKAADAWVVTGSPCHWQHTLHINALPGMEKASAPCST